MAARIGESRQQMILAQIAYASDAGAWDRPGITSSSANASQFGVGYGEASVLSGIPPIFGTVDADAVLVRLTRYGDATLDGAVGLADFNRLAANFGATSAVWTQGDFTYDGVVNLADFNILAGRFGMALAPQTTATRSSGADFFSNKSIE